MSVTLSNNAPAKLRTLRASAVTWRAIRDENAEFSDIPLQSLWKMWKTGKVLKKYRRKDDRTRYRVSVDADTHARIKAEADRRGVSMGEYVRRKVDG